MSETNILLIDRKEEEIEDPLLDIKLNLNTIMITLKRIESTQNRAAKDWNGTDLMVNICRNEIEDINVKINEINNKLDDIKEIKEQLNHLISTQMMIKMNEDK